MKVKTIYVVSFGEPLIHLRAETDSVRTNLVNRYQRRGCKVEEIHLPADSTFRKNLIKTVSQGKEPSKNAKLPNSGYDAYRPLCEATDGAEPDLPGYHGVGMYLIFHGTSVKSHANVDEMAWVTAQVANKHPGQLRKVVMLACCFAMAHPPDGHLIINNYFQKLTALVVSTDNLPRVAAWNTGVTIDGEGKKLVGANMNAPGKTAHASKMIFTYDGGQWVQKTRVADDSWADPDVDVVEDKTIVLMSE